MAKEDRHNQTQPEIDLYIPRQPQYLVADRSVPAEAVPHAFALVYL